MSQYLLLVTVDGYGKRIPVRDIPRQANRGAMGVTVSKVPLAAALIVDDSTPELVLMSKAGMFERIATASVPVRRRRNYASHGVALMRLKPGDEIASVVAPRIERT